MRRERARGQAIIEVIIAVGIVTFALLGAVAATTRAIKTSRVASQKAEALVFANQIIEKIKIDKESDVKGFFAQANSACNNDYDLINGVYSADVTCSGLPGDEVSVNVEVTWTEGDSTLSVSLDTKLTKTKY